MNDRYTIISADAHAGLPCEEYRPYLDERYHAAVRRVPRRAAGEPRPADEAQLRLHHALGDRARRRAARRVRRRAARQGDGRRRRRGRGDLPRRRRDHRHGVAAVRRRACRRARSTTPSSRSRARVRTTASSSSCARRARCGAAASGSCRSRHDVERAVAEIEWLADKPGIRGIMIPTMWRDHTPYNDPSYDPVWAACQAAQLPGARALGRGAARGDERVHRHLPRRGRVLDAPADRAPAVQRRVRALPGPEVRRDRRRVATGSPT